jgi:hypothetical protein
MVSLSNKIFINSNFVFPVVEIFRQEQIIMLLLLCIPPVKFIHPCAKTVA